MARSGTEATAERRRVAFLRGINVGGRRVTGTQLCAPVEALGLGEVGTFLAQVTFLHEPPDPDAVAHAVAHASGQDRIAVIGREWYWLPQAGISTSSLDVRAVERALGRGTTRTRATVTRLHARLR